MIQSLIYNQKRLLILLSVIAAALTLPSLFNGFVLDDYYHRIRMLDAVSSELLPQPNYFLGLFSFLNGRPEQSAMLVTQGVLPWWVLPDIKYTFFRPLSELTIAIDYQLWPNRAELMHLHNSFWFVLCIFAAGLFLFKFAPYPVAVLSLVFFLLEGSHGFAISWLASRNALIACAMTLFSLYFITRFVEEKNKPFYVFSLLFYLLALSAGEMGITCAAFLCLYLLIFSKVNVGRKLLYCLPIIIMTLLWLSLRAYLDFGAYGTGAYIDPFAEPMAFFYAIIEQLPIIFFSLCVGIPVEITNQLIHSNTLITHNSYLILSIFLLVIILPLFYKNKRAYFYLLAGMAASVPVLAGELQSRVLVLVSFPLLCFVAECLVSFWQMQKAKPESLIKKMVLSGPWVFSMYALGFLALLSHLIFAPIFLIFSQGLISENLGKGLKASVASLAEHKQLNTKTVLIVNPPNASAAGYLAIMLALENNINPRQMYLLSSGAYGVHMERTGSNSIELEPQQGFLIDAMDRVMRSDQFPFVAGQSLFLDGLLINISQLNKNNRPQRVGFYFSENLDSNKYLVLCWQGQGEQASLQACTLPTIGEKVWLEPVSF